MSLLGQRNSGRFDIVQGRLVTITDNQNNYIVKGYEINDIIFSIINLILDKVRVAPWGVYKIIDESSLKSYHGLQAKKDFSPDDYRKAKDLQRKSLEPVKVATKWTDLLKYPNDKETFNDFVANGCGYKLLTGNKHVWADILLAGANKGTPNSLHNMPSQFVQILATEGFPGKVLGYELYVLGLTGNSGFSVEEVMHEKYMNYSWTVNGQHYYGMSPLKAALRLTNRNNSALDASTAKFQNGGMEAIIYMNDQRFDAEQGLQQMNAVKASLINEYSGPLSHGKIATSGYPVGVANLGLSPVELDLIQAEMWDLRRFCNIYGVPSQMMNDPQNKSYNNSKEGEKALTSRCALPLLTSFRDNFNRKRSTVWGGEKGTIVDFDMTVFTELQETVGETLRWVQPLLQQGWPLNRALEMLAIEKLNEPEADEMWITPGMGVPISEWRVTNPDTNASTSANGQVND